MCPSCASRLRLVAKLSSGFSSASAAPPSSQEWVEISRAEIYVPHANDVGRKLKLEAAAYAVDSGELLMHRVVKTDLVLSRAPAPAKRELVAAKVIPIWPSAAETCILPVIDFVGEELRKAHILLFATTHGTSYKCYSDKIREQNKHDAVYKKRTANYFQPGEIVLC